MAMRQYKADVETCEITDPVTGEIQSVELAPPLPPDVQQTRRIGRGGQVRNTNNYVTVREVTRVGGNDVINQDFYQQRLNYRDPSTTNPQRRPMGNAVKTIKTRRPVQEEQEQDERTYRVDVQREGKRPFSFYVRSFLATGAIILGIAAWIAVPQWAHHYHVGDNPVHQYRVVMDGEPCDATAYLNGPRTAIDIIITPQDKKSKATPEARYALNDGENHEITLQTNMDVNGDGKSDIIVLSDGRQVGVLLANKDGNSFEWSKQS